MIKEDCEIETGKAIMEMRNHIADLEKENTELQDKLKNLASVAEVRLANWQKCEKENEELRIFRQDCIKLTEDNVVMARQRAETSKQLAKAKSIIKKLVEGIRIISDPKVCMTDVDAFVSEAEQFLKEAENGSKE